MSNSQKTKILKLRTLTCLVLAFMLSLTLFATACGKKKDDNNTPDNGDKQEEQVDEQIIKNGNFEFVNFAKDDDGNDKVVFPVTSVNNWSRSSASTISGGSTNPASNYDSGIIDTNKLDDTHLTFKKETDEQLASLKGIGLQSRHGNAEGKDSRVLMIANQYKDSGMDANSGYGTAQKFTSSTTLTLEHGFGYKISVWVRTNGLYNADAPEDKTLKNYHNQPVNGAAGAYVGITSKLNSSNVSPFYITNIDTQGEWEQCRMYIEPADFGTTTITVVLGLGFGSADVIPGYVEGYAFFDDVSYEAVPLTKQAADDKSAYEAQVNLDEFKPYKESGTDLLILDENDKTNFVDFSTLKDDAKGVKGAKFSLSVLSSANRFDNLSSSDYQIRRSVSDEGKASEIKAPALESEQTKPVTDALTLSKIDSAANFKNYKVTENGTEHKPYDNFFSKFPFETTDKVLLLRTITPSALTFTLNENFKVESEKFYAVSLYVKTLEINFGQGATMTVIDKGIDGTKEDDYVKNSFSAIDTTSYKSDDEDKKDYLDGWKKFTFFIKNSSSNNKETNFSLEFNFGLTTQSKDANQYNSGWAAFTKLSLEEVSIDLYERSSDGTFVKKVALTDSTKVSDGSAIDSIMAGDRYTTDGSEKIETQAVAPANYRSVSGGTKITGYNRIPSHDDYFNPKSVYGLMDSKHIANYSAFTGLNANMFEDPEVHPVKFLGIYNKTATTYGYISKNATTVPANSYAYIAVDVIAVGGAKPFVYLTNNSYKDNYSVLKLERPAVSDKYTKASAEFVHTVEGAAEFKTVWFFVQTGDESKTFNIELWNGSRDGETSSAGLTLFKSLRVDTSVTKEAYDAFVEALDAETDSKLMFTRQPDIFYDPENGSADLKEDYDEQLVYGINREEKIIIASFAPIDVKVETTDDTDDNASDDTDSKKPANKPNIWLLLSSLLLAVVLIAALVMVLVRKIRANMRKKNVNATTRYHAKKKHYTGDAEIGEDLDISDDETDLSEESDDLE